LFRPWPENGLEEEEKKEEENYEALEYVRNILHEFARSFSLDYVAANNPVKYETASKSLQNFFFCVEGLLSSD
jgi:hypothetical protein